MSGHAEQSYSDYYTYGKYWAVVHKEKVVSLISMRVPPNCDFNAYRDRAREVLKTVGKVIAGEVIEHDGEVVFFERQKRPGKHPKSDEQKTYPVPEFKKPFDAGAASPAYRKSQR